MQSAPKVPDELRRILADVCAEYHVRIDPDDPAVAMIMLNRLVLELALNRAVERIETATAALNAQVDAVQIRTGAVLAQELRSALQCAGKPFEGRSPNSPRPTVSGAALISAAFALIFSVGVAVGVLLR